MATSANAQNSIPATPRARWLRHAVRYGLAVLSVGAAWAVRTALEPFLSGQPFEVFLVPVLLMAWRAGFGPAVLAAALGWLVGDWFFCDPRRTLLGGGAQEATASLVFAAISAALIATTHQLRYARRQLATNIEHLKRAEEAVRRSEARLRAAFDHAGVGIVEVKGDDRFIAVNNEACRILGRTPEQLLAMNVHELTWPEDRPLSDRVNRELHAGLHDRTGYEKRYLRGDGSPVWAHVTVAAVRDSDGQWIRSVTTIEDITERKRAEDQLRRSHAKLETALASTTDAVCISDAQGRFIEINDAFAAFHRFANKEDCFRTLWEYPDVLEVFSSDGQPVPVDHWPAARALRGEVVTSGEYLLRRKDTGENWVGGYSFAPIRDKDGAIVGSVVVGRDITERKRGEEELRRLKEELEVRIEQRTAELRAANKELEAFAYSVSHDLRAPLRHIGSYVNLLQKSAGPGLDEKNVRYLKIIEDATRRMGNLIDDLLVLSRLGRATMDERPVDLRRVVDEARQELAPVMAGRQFEWGVGPLPCVRGDPNLLRSAIVNLLANAIKYTRPRNVARIEVRSLEQGNELVCFVRDNGAGFDMRFVNKLFGVFQRLHTAQEFEGTGIGLASVRRVIQRHGGRTWAEGEPDKGATFYFSLPVSRIIRQPANQPEPVARWQRRSPLTR